MGSSGLLLVGVVLLWVFGAMPHWVRRSEALAVEHAASDPAAQRTVRRRPDGAGAGGRAEREAATSSGGILGRPRRDDEPRPAGATAAGRGARPDASPPQQREDGRAGLDHRRPTSLPGRRVAGRPVAGRVPRERRARRGARRALAVLALLALLAVLAAAPVAVPALLAASGASGPAVVLVALALVALTAGVLRVRARRAAVRRRALARRRAARPWLVPSSAPATSRRPAARVRHAGDAADRRHAMGA